MEPFARLARSLKKAKVQFVLIGVAGADYYARSTGLLFTTQDWDLFLPPDPDNALRAWKACETAGLELWLGDEPLWRPLDRFLVERVAIPVARLSHIVAGRPKDHLFLATHEEALRSLLRHAPRAGGRRAKKPRRS